MKKSKIANTIHFLNAFSKFEEDVRKWNRICSTEVTSEKIQNQFLFVASEASEMLAAVKKDDIVEQLDGFADIAVTYSYLTTMNDDYLEAVDAYFDDRFQNFVTKMGDSVSPQLLNVLAGRAIATAATYTVGDSEMDRSPDRFAFIDCMVCMEHVITCLYGRYFKEGVTAISFLEEVMRSNWTKYSHRTDSDSIEYETSRLEKEYGVGNIGHVYVPISVGIQPADVILYTTLYDGKIRKPSTYQPPNIAALLNIAAE